MNPIVKEKAPMKATQILRQEHKAILKMLDAAETVADSLENERTVPGATIAEILEFLRIFADRCHHGKEEELLFPALTAKGLPERGGPVGVMLFEHEQGRALIRRMAEAFATYAETPAPSGLIWASAAREYAALLRAHIQKEDNILFVMAERLLSEAELEELGSAFDRIETEKIGAGTHERLHATVERITAAGCGCTCGH
jgi:hemerythrin-like domain-containing protein